MRRNQALEEELRRLKETMGVPVNTSPYSTPVYEDSISASAGTGPSPSRGSPFHGGYDASLQDYGASYVPIPDSSASHSNSGDGSWNAMTNGVPSTGSSPSSSTDDYNGTAYIPTSIPSGMMPPGPNGSVKMEYEENGSDQDVGFPQHLNNGLLQMQLQQQQHHSQHPHHSMVGHSSSTSSPDQPLRSIPWATSAQPVFPMLYPQQQSPVH